MWTKWTREELKTDAKKSFNLNYWRCVLVALITGLVTSGGAASGRSAAQNLQNQGGGSRPLSPREAQLLAAVATTVIVVAVIACVIGILISVFLLNPVLVGCDAFFIKNAEKPSMLDMLKRGFSVNYKNVVKTMFLMRLFTFLWTLLFIIPGIIKAYEYRMIPYLLADDPNMSYEEAFARSKEMMDGNKWKAFVLDLSFIGWAILSILTLGLLALFYVDPYICQTNANLYLALSGNRIAEQPSEQPLY